MAAPVLAVEGVSKKFCPELRRALRYGARDIAAELLLRREQQSGYLRPGEFWALRDVSFDLAPGESLGIVGQNGAGKSTLLRLVVGLTRPDTGEITVRGRVAALLSLGAGFDPVLTGRENIYVEAAALGRSSRQTRGLLEEIVEFAELGDFIDAPVQTYSAGMKMRLGFAVATSLEADLLLLDEVLIVGDISFRRKGVEHIQRFVRNGGSLVLVSHEIWLVQAMCTRGILLRDGVVEFSGESQATVNQYYEQMVNVATNAGRAVSEHRPMSEGPEPAGPDAPEAEPAPGDDETVHRPTSLGPKAEPVPEVSAAQPVEILAAHIVGPEGGEVTTGQPAYVEVEYEAQADVEAAHWGVLVWTADRSTCITATIGDALDHAVTIAAGPGRLRCRIEKFPLMAGTYLLGVAVHDAAVDMPIGRLGWERPAAPFAVRNVENRLTTAQRTIGVLVDLEVNWNTTRGPGITAGDGGATPPVDRR